MSNPLNQRESLRQQAELHASRKEWPQAVACFEALLHRHPGDTDVLLQLSYVESLAGHYRAAREYALRAYRAGSRDPAVLRELVARLRTFNEAEALLACIGRLQPLSRAAIPLLIACAGQLSNLNEQERALELLEEARRGDPDYPSMLLARGQVLTYLGRFKEAEADLLRCQRHAPEIANSYWWLSRLRKQTGASNHVDPIRIQLQRAGRKPEEIALLAYALHKELDDLGEYDAAWQALEQACQAKRSVLDYASRETFELITKLTALPVPRPDEANLAQSENGAPMPIFIVGMHRSGTTLLEQMLHGSRAVRALGELYDFTSQMRLATDYHCRGVIDRGLVERAAGVDFTAVGAGYLAGVAWRLGGEPFFTDKLPSNFLNAGFICRALPNAKILHMKRDPMETCFSNLRELFSDANPYSYDQTELGSYYRQYQRLMAHWHEAYPGRILDVEYGDLVSEPEAAMRRVADFCGIPFETEMLDLRGRTRAVATASAVAVRGSVAARAVPKWKPYESRLQPLRDALGDAVVPSS